MSEMITILRVTKDSDWVPIIASGPANWISVSMSPDGDVVFAVRNGTGTIGISFNRGDTWQFKTSGAGSWIGSTILSRDKSTAYAMGNTSGNGAIGRSLDGGITWGAILGSATGGWYSCDCSTDGSILYAGKSLSGNATGGLYKSTNFGNTLTLLGSAGVRVWRSIAICKNNVETVYASGGTSGVILKTTDGGVTWNTILTGADFWKVRCSADGQTVLVTSATKTYVSTDGGSTWVQFNCGSLGACLSPDGMSMLIANYVSYDKGATWDQLKANNASWEGAASSDDFSNVITGINLSGTYLYRFVPVQVEVPDNYFIPQIHIY